MKEGHGLAQADRVGYLGILALLLCTGILSKTYQETYKFLYFLDRQREARLQPDLISGMVALLLLFVIWRTGAVRRGVSRPVMIGLVGLFLYVCAALAAGIIKGSSTTAFLRLGSDALTAWRYWPVLAAIVILAVSSIAARQYILSAFVAMSLLIVFNLSPVSDAMGLAGFALMLLFAVGLYALVDVNAIRSKLAHII